ncbi:hypothetical protein JTB14_006649 [Gonioctena quinquepunctata]|nr:hypothetical protein JTB14_006649 [Gonioctena quinquepunctata]
MTNEDNSESVNGPEFRGSPGAGGSYLGDVNVSAILDSFSVSYDKRVRPNYGGPPVVVGVTMYVLSISSLSEVKMVATNHTKHVYNWHRDAYCLRFKASYRLANASRREQRRERRSTVDIAV